MIEADFSGIYAWADKALAALADTSAPLAEAAQVGEDAIKRRIQSDKTTPDGEAWAPWSLGTSKARERRGTSGNGLLYDSGKLLNSISASLAPGALSIAPTVDYAGFLDGGTSRMPAREFMGWSESDEEEISAVFAAWFDRSVS